MIDIVFTLVIILLAIRGAIRGFITEFMSWAAVLSGLILGVLFSGLLSLAVAKITRSSYMMWNQLIAFLVIFIAVYVVVKLFENGIDKLVEKINLENLDRVLGFFLGIVEGFVVVMIIVFVLDVQPFSDTRSLLDNSLYVKIILPLIPRLFSI